MYLLYVHINLHSGLIPGQRINKIYLMFLLSEINILSESQHCKMFNYQQSRVLNTKTINFKFNSKILLCISISDSEAGDYEL